MPHHLILDGYNLIHRARGGFQKGDWPIVFNFFRGLRPIVERFLPAARVSFVLEGTPRRNLQLLPEYKANRGPPPDGFGRQRDEIVSILGSMPIDVGLHPDHEADDLVHSLISVDPSSDHTVVSSDSDFTQLLQSFQNVGIWNWRTDEFLVKPDLDYIRWKALRGDPTDNIPKCPGMTEAAALRAAKDDNWFGLLMQDAEFQKAYVRNEALIRLDPVPDARTCVSRGRKDWSEVKRRLADLGFKSMVKDGTWEKWVATFDRIGG